MSTLWDQAGRLRSPVLAATAALPAARREAEAFRAVLAGLPIGIRVGDVLAGDFGPEWGDVAGAPAPSQPAGRAPGAAAPSPRECLRDRFHIGGGYTTAHTTLDYGRIVREGLASVSRRAREHAPSLPDTQRASVESMALAVEAVCAWAERYADLAEGLAARAVESAERERLRRIAQACRHVPREPARDLYEALQSIWLVHAAIGISELSQASLSLGCLDRYLWPLFATSADPDLVRAALRDFFGKLNRYGDPAATLNLGGVGPDGADLFNPLSALIVDTVAALRLPAPLLAARIHVRTPPAVFDCLTRPELIALGQPTFYGEESCVAALLARGIPADRVQSWCANSCMGLYMPGEEICDMWGGVVNLLVPLELALNHGRPLRGEMPVALHTPPATAQTLPELQATLLAYTREFVDLVVQYNRDATAWQARERPNPFLSALTADCLERGLDRAGGGARYYGVTVEAFGLVNAADALTAIDEVVFRSRRYTLAEVTAALAGNFAGAGELRQALLAAPKFGRAHAGADGMVRWLADAFADAVSGHNRDGIAYLPSFHTLNAHLGAGAKTAASADGRGAGEPLAKNLGPMLRGPRFDATAVLLSCSTVDQRRFAGGQAVDLSLDGALLGTQGGRAALQALLRTYFGRGGLQVQVNGVTPALLRSAMADPEHHGHVIVRIAGYSARFVSLSRAVQEEMVHRFECGL